MPMTAEREKKSPVEGPESAAPVDPVMERCLQVMRRGMEEAHSPFEPEFVSEWLSSGSFRIVARGRRPFFPEHKP
jgi:hypothetical protein